jgi:hypothetical protein
MGIKKMLAHLILSPVYVAVVILVICYSPLWGSVLILGWALNTICGKEV